MKKKKETKRGEQFSSSPWLTRQVMEINKRIERMKPLRAFGKIYALWSDLPEEVRERAKPRISIYSAERDGINEKYIEEAKDKGFDSSPGGKRDYNQIYNILCTSKLAPERHTAYFRRIEQVREIWMRLRDVIKDAGLLDDRTRTIMSGAEG